MYEYDVTVTRGSTSLKVKIETDISHESPRALYPQEISSRFVGLSKEELTKFLGGGGQAYYNLTAAAAIIAALPPLILALTIQRYLVRGLSFGAVKA